MASCTFSRQNADTPHPGHKTPPNFDHLLLLAQHLTGATAVCLAVDDGLGSWQIATKSLHTPHTLQWSSSLLLSHLASHPTCCIPLDSDAVVAEDPIATANPTVGALLSVPLPAPHAGCLVVFDALDRLHHLQQARESVEVLAWQAADFYRLHVKAQQVQKVLPVLCHELNTPLNGILGLATIMEGPYCGDIVECASAALRTVQQLQDYVEVAQEEHTLSTTAFPALECLREVLGQRTDGGCRCDTTAVPDVDLITDLGRLRHILALVLDSVVKATPQDEEVRVSLTDSADVGRPGVVQFTVGAAEPREEVPSLNRRSPVSGSAGSALSPRRGDYGLGLVIAEALCESLSGRLWSDSSIQGGAVMFTLQARVRPRTYPRPPLLRSPSFILDMDARCFESVTNDSISSLRSGGCGLVFDSPRLCRVPGLPFSQRREADTRTAQPSPPPGCNPESLAILVVDDTPVNLKVILGFFRRMGCSADTATNGGEALDASKKRTYDVIFTDVDMPVMDGITLTRELLAFHGPDAPCVVGVSANTVEENRQGCLGAGMAHFLAKPLRFGEVQRVLNDVALLRTRATMASNRHRRSSFFKTPSPTSPGRSSTSTTPDSHPSGRAPTPPCKPDPFTAQLATPPRQGRARTVSQPRPPATALGPLGFLRLRRRGI